MIEAMQTEADQQTNLSRFIDKARLSAAIVTEVASLAEALDYTVDLCGKRGACRIKVSGCDEPLSQDAEALCDTKQQKIIGAPSLPSDTFALLQERCAENGFTCLKDGLRSQLAGIDIGFTFAELGLAETGTLVVNCPSEELRLATMICEYHVCVLPKSKIVSDGFEASEQLKRFMHKTPDYTAFITGPSRTADIERVLTIGVHGPLELHILLLEE